MLRAVRGLHGTTIQALDGEIGRVDEFLFDDEHWTVRYLIVNTGNWLIDRKVLISPLAIGHMDWEQHMLSLNLTRAQIENSPGAETDKPVSRQWESEYYNYYAWPYYWGGMGAWGAYWYPETLYAQPLGNAETPQQKADGLAQEHADAHLRSTKAVTGYGISATDGHLGHVQDFIVNDETWRICYLAVDTLDWWPGKKVLLPLNRISGVSWPDRSVTVNVTRDQVRNAPEWDPREPISRLFEDQLSGYYAKQSPTDREQPRADVSTQPEIGINSGIGINRIGIKKEKLMQTKSLEQTWTQDTSAVVAVYDTHTEAEAAVRELQHMGFDMTKLSIVGKNYHTDEDVIGYYNAGDRMKSWGKTGAFWGGLWGLLLGSAFFFVPGVGPIVVAGPLVAWIVGALEGAVVVGGVSALGAALFSIGIPKDSIIQYETQIKAGKYVVIAHDTAEAIDRATIVLKAGGHKGVENYALNA